MDGLNSMRDNVNKVDTPVNVKLFASEIMEFLPHVFRNIDISISLIAGNP